MAWPAEPAWMQMRRVSRGVPLAVGGAVVALGCLRGTSLPGLASDYAASPRELPILVLDRRTGSLQRFPRLAGRYDRNAADVTDTIVYAAIGDGRGGWFIGGEFEFVGGIRCRNLAHITRGGRVDRRWCLNPNATIRALARTTKTLYIGGGPASPFIGDRETKIAAIDLGTARLTSWDPQLAAPYVLDIDVHRSLLYIAGEIYSVGHQPRLGFAAIDATTGSATAWDAHAEIDYHGAALGIAAFGSTVYLWGNQLYQVGRARRCDIAAVSAATGRPTSWNPCPRSGPSPVERGGVTNLQLQGDRLFVSGWFTSIAGVKQRSLASFNASSGKLSPWKPQVPQTAVATIAVAGRIVYVVTVGPRDESPSLLFGVDGLTGERRGWHVRLNGPPNVLAANRRSLVLGGQYLRILGR